MKVWITKYALTSGVVVVSPVGDEEIDDEVATVPWASGAGGINGSAHFYGNDWHRSRESAVARVEQMKKAMETDVELRIASLTRQLKALRDLTIEVPE